jgi:multidrug efflux pump subunit AcrA (membrane-fusion protein)
MDKHVRVHRLLIAAALCCLAGQATAGNFYFPSTRWIMLSSPWSPKSYEECQALSQEFSEITRELNAQHEECLQGAPQDQPGGGPICSRTSCQALHTARDSATKKSSEEGQTCRQRVSAYLESKRREEAEARKRQEEAERETREEDTRRAKRDQERAQDETKRKADRDRRDREYKDEQARRDREDRERDARRDAERREQEAREKAERQAQEAKDAARYQRDVLRAQMEAKQREKDKGDQAAYEKELEAMRALKAGGIAGRVTLSKNPFETAARLGAREMDREFLDAGLDASLPFGEQKHDIRHDASAAAVNVMQSVALRPNPFAKEVSKTAMHGVQTIQRKVLGEMDKAAQAIEEFGRDDAAASRGTGPVFRPASPPPSHSARNPFSPPTPATTYQDPDTRVTLEVPSGHVLYRAPETNRLTAVSYAQVSESSISGDRPELGEKGCSATGVGIVTPECEKKRRAKANPFSAK